MKLRIRRIYFAPKQKLSEPCDLFKRKTTEGSRTLWDKLKEKPWYNARYLWWLNTPFVRDHYELEQNRSSAAKRMIANDEPGCLSVMWQIMSWWLIESHSASTRGAIVMQTGEKKGFHKISSPNHQAESDGHASGWAGALLAETKPDILLLHLREEL